MTIKELDQRLTLVLEDFSSEMRSEYDDYSNEPVTGGDIAQLSRQTFYALDEFRKEIIKYLESKRKSAGSRQLPLAASSLLSSTI